MDTYCYRITTTQLHPETVIALLGDLPFSAFDIAGDVLRGYVPQNQQSAAVEAAVNQLAQRFGLAVELQLLADRNWNAEWERDYPLVRLDDWLCIRAPFHEPSGAEHEIVLVPEMSFGTGHHETTYMMAQLLRAHSPFGKTCFDFGTGTGVLALLAAKLGASQVIATDNDPRCVASTQENADRNTISLSEVRLGDETSLPQGPFDLVLANINRGVLVKSLPTLAQRLSPQGQLWMSGILATDLDMMTPLIAANQLSLEEVVQRGDWLALRTRITDL